MSTLLNKYGKFYYVKLSTRGGGGIKKVQKYVNLVCERPHMSREFAFLLFLVFIDTVDQKNVCYSILCIEMQYSSSKPPSFILLKL